jgi:hypothetical protein
MALAQHVSLVVYVIFLLPFVCNASCSPETKTVQEQFEASTNVARLTYVNQPVTLPCGLEVYDYDQDPDGYVILDTLPLYKVEELFKGSLEGDDIPIVWVTDTGFRQEIPSSFNETGGFLAFLMPHRYCQNETEFFEYPANFQPTPYAMNECVRVNQPWSSVSDADRAFLREQKGCSLFDAFK